MEQEREEKQCDPKSKEANETRQVGDQEEEVKSPTVQSLFKTKTEQVVLVEVCL